MAKAFLLIAVVALPLVTSPADTTVAARLAQEVHENQRAVAYAEYLSDVIGARLTTSRALSRAHDWAEDVMVANGLEGVHREAFVFGPTWERGAASMRLLTQNGMSLKVAQIGWSPSTDGPIRGELLVVSARTPAELDAYRGTLAGKFLILDEMPTEEAALARFRNAVLAEGARASLFSSFKEEGLMEMVGSPRWRSVQVPRMPAVFVSSEHFAMLLRAVARSEKVELELEVSGIRGQTPVEQFNSVGEIRGWEHPDEVVILGAHLDSWDLGTGATDDGTGVAVLLEAMRAIRAVGVVPRRTIRVVLFSAEEQGHLGSLAYVDAHRDELADVQAMLQHDLGTGRVLGFALQGRDDARALMAKAIAPLNEIGVTRLPLQRRDNSDHASFNEAGVPAFFAVQDTLDYFTVTHHSEHDTFDHVQPEGLVQGAIAMAVTAWELADMPERIPHSPPRFPGEPDTLP